MMKSKNVVAALRRDVSFIWHAVIAVCSSASPAWRWRRRCST